METLTLPFGFDQAGHPLGRFISLLKYLYFLEAVKLFPEFSFYSYFDTTV